MEVGNLRRWLKRESRRDARRVSLEDVLVFGGFSQYLWQRSRRFALTRTLQEFLHVGELYLLFLFASQPVFIATAIITAVARMVNSAWWGGLEVLRTGVRERSRDGRYTVIAPWIRQWMITSTALGCSVCAIGAGFTLVKLWTANLGVADAYLAARVIGVGLELPTRTFHSGAYALRRIYQPTWALLTPSLLRGLMLASWWPAVGVWSIPVASVFGVFVSVVLTAWFTRLAYIDLQLWPMMSGRRQRLPARLWSHDMKWFAAAALANISTSTAQLWTLSLLSIGLTNSDLWLGLFIYLVLVGPLFDVCQSWARLFYPDLADLENDLLRPFRTLLVQSLIRWSPVVGTLVWISTLIVLPLLPSGQMVMIALITWLFFIARARFAAIQVSAFCHRRYTILSLISFGLVLATSVAYWAPHGQVAWVVGGVFLCLGPFGTDSTRRSEPTGLMPVASLITAARWIRGEGTWVLSEFRPGWLLHGPQVLLQRSARHNAIGVDRESLLLRWQPAALHRRGAFDLLHDFERRRWRSATGFTLDEIQAWRDRWPAGPLPNSCTIEEVIAEFQSRFPNGFWVKASKAANSDLRLLLTWQERKHVLGEAMGHLFGRPPAALLPLDVSALVDDGQIVVLFFLKRTTSTAARRHWRRWLRQVGVANALAAVRSPSLGNTRATGDFPPAVALPHRWRI